MNAPWRPRRGDRPIIARLEPFQRRDEIGLHNAVLVIGERLETAGFDECHDVLLPISPDERSRRAQELNIRHRRAVGMDSEMIFEAHVEVDDRGDRPCVLLVIVFLRLALFGFPRRGWRLVGRAYPSPPAPQGPWPTISSRRIWASSSFLRHYDEAQILLKSQPHICAIGADGGHERHRNQIIFGSTESGRIPVGQFLNPPRATEANLPAPPKDAAARKGSCSINGKFLFAGIPDGEYYAITMLFPRAMLGKVVEFDDIEVVMKRVKAAGGRTVRLDLLARP